MDFTIPNVQLRDYQKKAWNAFQSGAKRLALVWPRRSGKDTISLQMMCSGAMERVGNYIHMMPYAVQVKKAMWRGINREGQRIIDVAFPHGLRRKVYENEMLIELVSGSTVQFGGSDNADALVGGNPCGIIMSELSISNPMAVNLIRPILAENGGWLIAPYTPRGKTFGYNFFNNCAADPNSFAQLLTCDDTGHMSPEALALERAELDSELFLQEYYCSWNYGALGSVYGRQITAAVDQKRITTLGYDAELPVFTAFDIGFSDATAMWTFQLGPGKVPLVLDYHEKRGEHPAYYGNYLRNLGYPVSELFLPHDADHQRMGQLHTVIQQFQALGFKCRMLPRETSIAAGIARGRALLGKAVFNQATTETGINMLGAYKFAFNEKTQTWSTDPVHDFSSHGADSWRYLAQAVDLGWCYLDLFGDAPDYSNLNRAAI